MYIHYPQFYYTRAFVKDATKSAIRIQSVFRGWQTRKVIKEYEIIF